MVHVLIVHVMICDYASTRHIWQPETTFFAFFFGLLLNKTTTFWSLVEKNIIKNFEIYKARLVALILHNKARKGGTNL